MEEIFKQLKTKVTASIDALENIDRIESILHGYRTRINIKYEYSDHSMVIKKLKVGEYKALQSILNLMTNNPEKFTKFIHDTALDTKIINDITFRMIEEEEVLKDV